MATLLNPNTAKYFYKSNIVTNFKENRRQISMGIDFGRYWRMD
jgi:hypothetical protein